MPGEIIQVIRDAQRRRRVLIMRRADGGFTFHREVYSSGPDEQTGLP